MDSKSHAEEFLKKSEPLKAALLELARLLDMHQYHFIRSSLAGAVISGIGAVICIIGGSLAIATFGVSAVLLPLGGAIATAGGVIGGTAFIADHFISKKMLDEAQKMWEEFQKHPFVQEFVQSVNIPEEFRNDKPLSIWQKIKKRFRQNKVETAEDAVKATGSTSKAILKILDLVDEPVTAAASTGAAASGAGRMAFRSLSAASKALLIGGLVVDGILLPLTIADIVECSIEIHKGTKSPAGDTLRSLVETIEEMENKVRASCEFS